MKSENMFTKYHYIGFMNFLASICFICLKLFDFFDIK
jgi:hypothetical protein